MARIKSNHDAPLGLPGGPVIPAGKTVSVEKWDKISGSDVVKAWLSQGAIAVVDEVPTDVSPARKPARRKTEATEGEGSE